jgi:ABC-2 type transport system ATP-binding protein
MTGQPQQLWGASALRVAFGATVALDDVSVTVKPGQVAAVVGGDGAGKTTLLRCLAGALRPDRGQVTNPGPLRIGYLPAASGVYPDLTVTENLAFRATAYGMTREAAARRSAELIEQAGLATAKDRLAGQLSGGMRQKLGVIAAVLHQPELLILDEPSTGVDPVSRSGLWWLIASAAADGAAVILATTYIDDAQRAGAVLVLDSGRKLTAGTPEEIVAAMPGSLTAVAERPVGSPGQLAWRRGASWRVWNPPAPDMPGSAEQPGSGQQPAGLDGEPVAPDLQDAVTVAALGRELALAAAGGRVSAGQPGAATTRRQPSAGQSWPAGAAAPAGRTESLVGGRRSPGRGPLAECVSVTRRFGDFTAVRDVSVSVRSGEIVGLLGANGAGKTTLIRMLLGLIPPTAGQVRLLGAAPSRPTRRRIGYVPQGLGLYEDLTAAENMDFTAAVFGQKALTLPADLTDRSGVLVGSLPLGLQRRMAFAQALAHAPDLLILDEPTSGVDPLGRARLWQTIGAAARAGAGVLVSTHYMEEAGECDRLIIMADGEVVAEGAADQIIGGAQVTVVEAADWAEAFGCLERAGLQVSLAGRTLRVPGASPADVGRALGDAGPAEKGRWRVYEERATLEERFFELAQRTSQYTATSRVAAPAVAP